MSSRSVPLYTIGVVTQLTGVAQTTLRLYENHGLVAPARTEGGTRRYSDDDVATIRIVAELHVKGVNLVGIAHVLELRTINDELRRRLAENSSPDER